MSFIREQGVIGLAVGLVLGGAVLDLVKAFINDFINPLLGLAINHTGGLKEAYWDIGGAKLKYGDFLTVSINFLVVAALIYFVVHGFGFDRLDAKKEEKK